MSYEKYLKRLLFGVLSLIVLCCSFIIIIDPAFQYHMPFKNIKPVYSNERYQNAGLAKHLEYDSVILGSSVTSNFRASWFDELFGGKTIKLSLPGASFKDFDITLDLAFRKQNIKRVFWSIDPKILMTKYNSQSTPLPEYLYNDNIFDDSKYLINKDVLVELCSETIIASLNGKEQSLDDAFSWEENYEFSQFRALWGYIRPQWNEKVISANKYDKIINENIESIKKYIEKYKQTEFYIFTPPYSVLYWDSIARNGTYPAVLKLYETIIKELTPYENVKYYCFSVNDCIFNLINYVDEIHFSKDINRMMAEYMAFNDGVDESYIPQMREFFKNIIEYYDFESVFPFAIRDLPEKRRKVEYPY